jgi:hypothetical protein
MAPKHTRQVEDDLQEDESEDCSGDEFEDESDNPLEDDSRQQVSNLSPKLFPSLISAKLGVGHCNNMYPIFSQN